MNGLITSCFRPQVRAKLSARFGSAMGLLVGESGDAFFAGRQWLDRGMRYPDLEGGATAGGDELDAVEVERQAITAALENELEELEAVFDEDRLVSIVWGSKAGARQPSTPPPKDGMLSLADVDRLCAEDSALEAKGAAGSSAALSVLAAFVVTGGGVAERGAARSPTSEERRAGVAMWSSRPL